MKLSTVHEAHRMPPSNPSSLISYASIPLAIVLNIFLCTPFDAFLYGFAAAYHGLVDFFATGLYDRYVELHNLDVLLCVCVCERERERDRGGDIGLGSRVRRSDGDGAFR
jgi:hypothetical protein